MATAAVCLLTAGAIAWVHFGETLPPPHALRYTVPLPKDGKSDGLYFQYGLSPDGRHLAVSGVLGEKLGIFVRGLDSLDWRFLVGTESSDILWSPDSQSIGFFEGHRLKTISVAGGPVEDVADIGPGGFFHASGAWSPDGIIVFAPPAERGLMSVPAAGGEPHALTTAESGVKHAYPAFLPDARHFLYTVEGGASPGIYVASLDDPAGRRLLADVSPAFFAASAFERGGGYLIFARNGHLMAQLFDANALELGGEASSIAEPALLSNDGALAAAVSDDGILAYLSGGNREYDSRLGWFDRSGHALAALGSRGAPEAVELSPDEKTAAITRPGPADVTADVWLRDMERGLENPLTHGDEVPNVSNVVWSPDGSRVAYSSVSSGAGRVYVADVSGSETPRPVLENGNRKIVTDWSGDGYLVYTESDPQTGADLKYLRLDGETATEPVVFRADEFDTSYGTLSPDGRWIAYVSNETGHFEVWVQAFPSGPGKWRVSEGGSDTVTAEQPRWSRDGRELFYVAVAGANSTMMSAPVSTPAHPGASPVGEPTALFEVRSNTFAPAQGTYLYDVSADGQRFLIDVFDEQSEPALNIVVNWERAIRDSR
jgi:eukaryotic-like serine/threonine-protein kinase